MGRVNNWAIRMNEKFFDLKSEKQDRIINASLHVFSVNGFKHASTDTIVSEAGISKGLLFHYFVSKQGLYEFLMDYCVRYMLFEIGRTVGNEERYFEFQQKLQSAKINILRNYPYMNEFMKKAEADRVAGIAADFAPIDKYNSSMSSMINSLRMPSLNTGISASQLDNLVNYTINGISAEEFSNPDLDADRLNDKIVEYLKLIKSMVVKA